MGFKSPLAYSSSFYFICRKNGVERKYMMYEGEETNTIDLLYETPTAECNGVKVIIPVKFEDRREFFTKIKEQLAYFENVFFDVYMNGETINNEFLISRSENYQFSELLSVNSMHLCLDNVYYPLDFSKLGIDRIHIPIALRFGLSDGLYPVPSRESIIISNKTKEIILAKISKIADEFITKFNNSVKAIDNIQDVFKYYNTNSRYIQIENKSIEINNLQKFSTIPIAAPALNNVSLLNLNTLYKNREYIMNEYVLRYTLHNNTFKENKNAYYRDIKPMSINNKNYYVFDETIAGNKKTYFRETLSPDTFLFLKKVKTFKLKMSSEYRYSYNNYYQILGLNNVPKEQWRQVIKEFQYVQSLLVKDFINVDDFVIPQQWFDDRKKARVKVASDKKIKLDGEITCKLAVNLLRYNQGNNCKFISHNYKLNEIHKQKCLFVYTSNDLAFKLDKIYELSKKQQIKFITFSERELKTINKLDIHNLISYEKFMEGKNAPFKRIVTAYCIKQLIDSNKNVFDKLPILEKISTSLYNKLTKLDKYKDTHYEITSNETIYKAMVEVAINNNLFDKTIYSEYIEMRDLLTKLPFINTIMKTMSYYATEIDPMFPVLTDMFKYHGQKMNYNRYNIKLNKPKVEVLTEETIEELV